MLYAWCGFKHFVSCILVRNHSVIMLYAWCGFKRKPLLTEEMVSPVIMLYAWCGFKLIVGGNYGSTVESLCYMHDVDLNILTNNAKTPPSKSLCYMHDVDLNKKVKMSLPSDQGSLCYMHDVDLNFFRYDTHLYIVMVIMLYAWCGFKLRIRFPIDYYLSHYAICMMWI